LRRFNENLDSTAHVTVFKPRFDTCVRPE